jgi:hypothetical protein
MMKLNIVLRLSSIFGSDYDFNIKIESHSKDIFDLTEIMDVFKLLSHLYLHKSI